MNTEERRSLKRLHSRQSLERDNQRIQLSFTALPWMLFLRGSAS